MPLLDSIFLIIKHRSTITPLGRWCHIPEYPIAKQNVLEWKIRLKENRDFIRQKGEDPYESVIQKTIKMDNDENEEYMRPYLIDW